MKTLLVFSCVAAIVLGLNACNHNAVDPTSAASSARSSAIDSLSGSGPFSLTTVAVSSLPTAITTYISSNYGGATVKEAKKDAKGQYLVLITINSTIKVLIFSADGTFLKELSAPVKPAAGDSAHHPKRDSTDHHKPFPGDSTHHPKTPGDSLHHPKPVAGDTTHHGGPGQGPGLTSVAISSLPATITSYITTNYAGSTIEKADQETKTSDYIVLIKTADNKRVLLLFGSDGTFKKAVSGR